jgi:uncharacterized protein involved in exopolysaccharide biosynthesis
MKRRTAQFTIDEVQAILRRRRSLFLLPLILVVGACTIGAFLLPRKYESSTTILVQRDEVLNPLVSFTMAVSMASEDRLRSLHEIIYSQSTIELLIDTLGLNRGTLSDTEHDELVKEIRKNVTTERKGGESFTLAYLDTDPRRAQAAVSFLTHHFTTTRLAVENQRNEYAVQFYERKLEELRVKFEGSQHQVIATMRQRMNEMPMGDRVLHSRVEGADEEIGGLDYTLNTFQRALASLRSFPEGFGTEQGRRDLLDLQRPELPFGADLRSLCIKYEEYARRYTPKYPEVQKLEGQILELVQRMKIAVESEIARLQTRRWELEKKRTENIQGLQQTSVAEKQDQDKLSNYSIYQGLYDEMKIKLEQARTTRDLARKATDQFIVIDPPRVPTEPSKPNRPLIILGGLGLGLFLGVLSAGLGELTDTRIRTPYDVEVYSRPIIAYLPDGQAEVRV